MQQSAEDAMMSSYKNLLILNTGSTHNMSCNESFVYDIKEKKGGIQMPTLAQNELRRFSRQMVVEIRPLKMLP